MLRRSILFVCLLSLVASSAAIAQNFGRVVIVVHDAKGEPVKGVKVTATCDELPRFEESGTTSKKGRVTISVIDATKVYQFKIEAEGYPALDVPIKPVLRQTITREVTLNADDGPGSGALPGTPGAPEGEVVFTAAQKMFNDGVLLVRDNDYAGAKAKFEGAIAEDPDLADSYSALAGIQLYEGDHVAAIASAEKYIELAGESSRGYSILYEAYRNLGNDEKAEEAKEALVRLGEGTDAAARLYNEGVQALKVGDNSMAKSRFVEALELEPELTEAYVPLAIAQAYLLEWKEAVATAEKALVDYPDDKNMLKIRYEGYTELGDAEQAAAAFQALAAVDPRALAVDLFDDALAAFNGGDMPEAIATFERVLEADPSYAKAHYHLGLAYVNQDDKAKAREHLQAFLDAAPDDPDAAVAREMISYLGS